MILWRPGIILIQETPAVSSIWWAPQEPLEEPDSIEIHLALTTDVTTTTKDADYKDTYYIYDEILLSQYIFNVNKHDAMHFNYRRI